MSFSLRTRIGTLFLSWMLLSFGIFGWLASNEMKHDESDLLKERLAIAYSAATYLDNTLRSMHALLDTAVNLGTGIPTSEQFATAEYLIRQAFARYKINVQDIAVVDRSGRVIIDIPEEPEMLGGIGYQASVYPEVEKAIKEGDFAVSTLENDPLTETQVVLLVSPLLEPDKSIAGALIVEISIKQLGLFFLSPAELPGQIPSYDGRSGALGDTGYVELIDANGFVLNRTQPGQPVENLEKSDQSERTNKLISEHGASVWKYTDHQRESYVLAFASLSTAPWGIAIKQVQSEVLDSVQQFRILFPIFGTLLLIFSLLLVWAVTQWLLKPIGLLTQASRQIARGDFAVTVPVTQRSELGLLSTVFNSMAKQLSHSREALQKSYDLEKEKKELRGQLLDSEITAREEERKRIARELHDELAQTLTALIMELEYTERTLSNASPNVKESLIRSKYLSIQALDNTRKLTFELRPADLDALGLVPALRSYIQETSQNSRVNYQIEAKGFEKRLSPVVETALFRIVQEGIRNIEKHAEAKNARINLGIEDSRIIVRIEDDGKGFDISNMAASGNNGRAFGLVGVQERAGLLGGTLRIDSEPGKGTKLTVTIPLANDNV